MKITLRRDRLVTLMVLALLAAAEKERACEGREAAQDDSSRGGTTTGGAVPVEGQPGITLDLWAYRVLLTRGGTLRVEYPADRAAARAGSQQPASETRVLPEAAAERVAAVFALTDSREFAAAKPAYRVRDEVLRSLPGDPKENAISRELVVRRIAARTPREQRIRYHPLADDIPAVVQQLEAKLIALVSDYCRSSKAPPP